MLRVNTAVSPLPNFSLKTHLIYQENYKCGLFYKIWVLDEDPKTLNENYIEKFCDFFQGKIVSKNPVHFQVYLKEMVTLKSMSNISDTTLQLNETKKYFFFPNTAVEEKILLV